jgi:hypothetical protein
VLTKENFTNLTEISKTKSKEDDNNDPPTESSSSSTTTKTIDEDLDLEAGLDSNNSNDATDDDDENDDEDEIVITIKRSTVAGQPDLQFTNACAICLDSYAVGDTVSWSMNEECNHVFHQFCLANSFSYARKKGKKCLCPTCRRRFFLPNNDSCSAEESSSS